MQINMFTVTLSHVSAINIIIGKELSSRGHIIGHLLSILLVAHLWRTTRRTPSEYYSTCRTPPEDNSWDTTRGKLVLTSRGQLVGHLQRTTRSDPQRTTRSDLQRTI